MEVRAPYDQSTTALHVSLLDVSGPSYNDTYSVGEDKASVTEF